jgi:hypothetical protein
VSDLDGLLRAIDEAMPKDSVLYVEGTSIAPAVKAYLEERRAPARRGIRRGALWPRARTSFIYP